MSTQRIELLKGDCLIELDKVADKSIQLVLIDPPYNISKDFWDYREDYYEFMEAVFIKLERKLNDNGSFFFFHNDFRIMANLDRIINERTSLKFKNFLIWNKRFEGSPKKGFLDGYIIREGLTCFNKMAEYMLFYTFDNSYKLKERRAELGVSQITISSEILSRTGGLTGWYSNLETGKNLPTRETIKPIEKHLGLTYDDIVPKFYNQKKDHSVWNYDLDSSKDVHSTPKPLDLLKNIILHTTDPDDIVLDCFAGTGSTGVACLQTNRKCILVEREETFIEVIENNIKKHSINTNQ